MDESKKENAKEDQDLNIVIDISPDKMDVFLTGVIIKEGAVFTSDKIKDVLNTNGVSFGVKEDVIASLNGNTEDFAKKLVASGVKPVKGEDASINYLVEKKGSIAVRKGDRIAETVPPSKGEEGYNVIGEKIDSEEGREVRFPTLYNVVKTTEKPVGLLCEVDGYLTISESEINIRPFFTTEIEAEGLKAWVTVEKQVNEDDFDAADLGKELKENHIVFGLKEMEVLEIFEQKKFGKKILIAEGKDVVHGRDGTLKFYFETEIRPVEDEMGNVDHKQLNLIQNVAKGAKLVEVLPPTEGEKGMTVTGSEILPKPGTAIARPAGANASSDPGNPDVLIADTDGHVMKKGNTVIVDPVFIVKEHVDYSTGNINSESSVVVNGEVKAGFKIKAKHDVEIGGYVEDAEIEAGGNILLKAGFGGKGDGIIKAKGKVYAKFCENQTVISDQDIVFCEYIMHCRIETKGKLNVTEQKGLIIGGEVFAQKGIEANIIGSPSYTPTKIITGVNKDAQEKYEDKRTILKSIQNKQKSVAKALELLMAKKLAKKGLSKQDKDLYSKLKKAKVQLIQQDKEIQEDFKELTKETMKFKDSTVMIHSNVYPRTFIRIFDHQIEIEEENLNICYKYTDEGIEGIHS
ncbi:MAG: DUF342 domain-containing protein [bacterium]|nr:DUF342 domain-containing protein [bacterium]